MAAPFIEELPAGYQTQLGKWFKEGRELSGGQWQKIALSRAFMREDADILVLDEPTAAMDARAEAQVFEQFQSLAHDRMVILISHRFSTVRMADQILVIQDGRVLEHGSHEALMQPAGTTRNCSLCRREATAERSVAPDVEPVTRTRIGLQVPRLGGILLDLLSQAVHQLLQQLAVAAAAMAPDVRQQSLGADDVAGVCHEDLQQARLELREPHGRGLADAQR